MNLKSFAYNRMAMDEILKESTNTPYTGKKFEYLKEWDLSVDKLNELGANGWELVSTASKSVEGEWCIQYVFKREII